MQARIKSACLLLFCLVLLWSWQKNARDSQLIHAVRAGEIKQVRVLLDRGADPNVNVYEQYPVLAPFKSLIGKGEDFAFPALLYALLNGHIEITHALLEKGADPNAHDNFDVPALRWAVRLNDTGLVEALLRRGAWVNARTQGQTALWQAQQVKQSGVVQILKQYGATL